MAVVAAALVGWWVVPSPGNGDGTDPRPITTITAPDAHSLLVDPSAANHILFGSHSGIQESRDGGFTWRAGSLGNADAMGLAASPNAPRTFYAAGHDLLEASLDGGESWQPLPSDLSGTDLHGFAQDPSDPARLYALVAGDGMFTSATAGETWSPLPAPPPVGRGHVAFATGVATLYVAAETGLAVSRDQGASWEPLPVPPAGPVLALAIPPWDPQTIYAGTSGGLARSTDAGSTWATLAPTTGPILAVAVAASEPGRVLAVAEGGAVYRSDDGGLSWLAPR